MKEKETLLEVPSRLGSGSNSSRSRWEKQNYEPIWPEVIRSGGHENYEKILKEL
jgi:hypothetical protein